jgi:hypothetical protein
VVLAGGGVLVARTSVPDGVVAAVTALGIVVVAIGSIASAGRDNA